MKEILGYLEKLPKNLQFLIKGPWSPMAYIILIIVTLSLMYTIPEAYDSFQESQSKTSTNTYNDIYLQSYRLILGLYCIYVTYRMYKLVGIFPFVSYTLLTWNLLTMRLLLAFFGQFNDVIRVVGDLVRFPALAGCTITVCVYKRKYIMFDAIYSTYIK